MKSFLCLFIALPAVFADDSDRICARAVELHRSGDIAAAIVQYEACLALKPGVVELRSNYGAALARSGRYQDAIQQYQRALAASPENSQLRYNLALAYYKEGDLTKAAETLQPLHAQAPEDMKMNLLLADCYMRLGEMKQVVDLLGPLEARHRDDPGFAYLLGTALIRSGDVSRGEAVVDRILHDADSPEAHFLLASAAFANRDFPSAVREFEKTVQRNPELPSVWSFYGQSLLYTGDAKGAEAAFRKELSVNPHDYEANVNLGAILSVAGKYQDALRLLEHALLVRPGSTEARLELVAVYEHLGRAADAERQRAELSRLGIQPGVSKDESGLLSPGSAAPRFALPALGGKGQIALAELLNNQPLALVFGSYTCPKFRFGAPALNELYDRYRTRVKFVMIYVDEAHADDNWQSTINQRDGVALAKARTFDDKRQYATLCERKLSIGYSVAVDGMDRAVEKAYNAWPSAAYLITPDGRIVWASRLGELDFHPADLEAAIKRIAGEQK